MPDARLLSLSLSLSPRRADLIGICGVQLQPLLTRAESGPNLFFHDEDAQPVPGECGLKPTQRGWPPGLVIDVQRNSEGSDEKSPFTVPRDETSALH